MKFNQVLNEVTFDYVSAQNFKSLINAISDKRLKKTESKANKALQYIKNYFSFLGKGSSRFSHLNGNEMMKLVSVINLYLYGDMSFEEAEKTYNKIIQAAKKRMA